MHRKALITGITGQDGSYLAEFLLSKGYEVHGIIRSANQSRIERLCRDESIMDKKLFLHNGDLDNASRLFDIIQSVLPDEVYNLGGQSHVRTSFDVPEYTGNVSGLAVTRLLEAIRKTGKDCRFFQASSSELFGSTPPPQSETSPFHPLNPYGIAKLYGYWSAINYREAYGLYVSNGILFNHESPRRSEDFVTRKITRAVARVVAGKQEKLLLGNLEARKDWGFAPDFVECAWMILQQEKADDFVIGTGESHSLKDFLSGAFGYVGLDWKKHVEIDSRLFRPAEVSDILADTTKARRVLGWSPKVSFEELIMIMMDYDLEEENCAVPGRGLDILRRKDFTWFDRK